jgi:hypothetical protein
MMYCGRRPLLRSRSRDIILPAMFLARTARVALDSGSYLCVLGMGWDGCRLVVNSARKSAVGGALLTLILTPLGLIHRGFTLTCGDTFISSDRG